MKNLRAPLCILLVVALCTFTACAGLGDWRYQNLPGGYEIVRANGQSITLQGPLDESPEDDTITSDTALGKAYIFAFCRNDRYIGVQVLPDTADLSEETLAKVTEEDVQFHLVDTKTGEVYGAYTAAEYAAQLKTLVILNMGDWIKTEPAPKGSVS